MQQAILYKQHSQAVASLSHQIIRMIQNTGAYLSLDEITVPGSDPCGVADTSKWRLFDRNYSTSDAPLPCTAPQIDFATPNHYLPTSPSFHNIIPALHLWAWLITLQNQYPHLMSSRVYHSINDALQANIEFQHGSTRYASRIRR